MILKSRKSLSDMIRNLNRLAKYFGAKRQAFESRRNQNVRLCLLYKLRAKQLYILYFFNSYKTLRMLAFNVSTTSNPVEYPAPLSIHLTVYITFHQICWTNFNNSDVWVCQNLHYLLCLWCTRP